MKNKTVLINNEVYQIKDIRNLVSIEKDNGYHPECANESWFIVSNLLAGEERIGIQLHCLIMSVKPLPTSASINVSIVNETSGEQKDLEFIVPMKEMKVSTSEFDIETKDFKFCGDANGVVAYFKKDGYEIDIKTKAKAPLLLICSEGAVDFLGVVQYDFAMPAMETTGSVTIKNVKKDITGITWYDRQWGDLPQYFIDVVRQKALEKLPIPSPIKGLFKSEDTGKNAMNWVWVNPQLDNGVNISIGEITMWGDKTFQGFATIVEPDGTTIQTQLLPSKKSEVWQSPRTGRKYPTRLEYEIPGVDCKLLVEVPFKSQEIVSEMGGTTKFEGAAVMTGTYRGKPVKGEGYVELVGDY